MINSIAVMPAHRASSRRPSPATGQRAYRRDARRKQRAMAGIQPEPQPRRHESFPRLSHQGPDSCFRGNDAAVNRQMHLFASERLKLRDLDDYEDIHTAQRDRPWRTACRRTPQACMSAAELARQLEVPVNRARKLSKRWRTTPARCILGAALLWSAHGEASGRRNRPFSCQRQCGCRP